MDDLPKIFAMQDGADFYIYADATHEKLLRTETAPTRVRDWDIGSAGRARKWFERQFKGIARVDWSH